MQYFRPKSYDEYYITIEKLGNHKYTLFAGGTDLIPRYERGIPLPTAIIDLKKIPGFSGIGKKGNYIEIGAGTTIEDLKNNDTISEYFQSLQQSTKEFGSVQIRNRATIGGNICNASPAGDTLPALYTFNAQLLLRNKNVERTVPIEDFILGPGENGLTEGELLHSILIPLSSMNSTFYKLGLREAMAISIINFAIAHHTEKLTIAIGAVAPTIVKYSGSLSNSINQILTEVDARISPIDDIRATAEYRRIVLKNMLSYKLAKILK